MKNIITLLLITFLSLQGCKKSLESQIDSSKEETFNEFIEKFEIDKNFRLNRIKFPLKGFNSEEFTETNSYFWKKEDWLFYSSDDFKNDESLDLKQKEIIKTDTSTIYRIFKPESGYDIKYHFKKESKKYYLDYYSYKNI